MKKRIRWYIEHKGLGGWTLWNLSYPLKKWAVQVAKNSYTNKEWRIVKFVEVVNG